MVLREEETFRQGPPNSSFMEPRVLQSEVEGKMGLPIGGVCLAHDIWLPYRDSTSNSDSGRATVAVILAVDSHLDRRKRGPEERSCLAISGFFDLGLPLATS